MGLSDELIKVIFIFTVHHAPLIGKWTSVKFVNLSQASVFSKTCKDEVVDNTFALKEYNISCPSIYNLSIYVSVRLEF